MTAELAGTYAEQLDDIAAMLVQAGFLTREDVERHGVRFALKRSLEPMPLPEAAQPYYALATVVRVAVGSDAVALEFKYREPGPPEYREPGPPERKATATVCYVSLPLTVAATLAAQLLEGIVDAVPRLQADLTAFSARVNALNAKAPAQGVAHAPQAQGGDS